MSKLPLDANLLGNAVIELNIARHILALYSREHQLVQLSLDKTVAILSDLFELRPEISLAVAKDTLIIDERHLDPKNPVFREFALALSRMSVALVSFVKGVTREEVYDFLRFLSRESAGISSETLPEVLAEYRLRHILIEPLDYRAFAFAEDSAKEDGSDEYLLERYIKALLDGNLPADGVQAVVENVEPGTLAVLMNQAGGELAQEASYDTVVSSYLRGGAGKPVSGGDLQRLMTFIAGLRPELKQQFLAASVKSLSRNQAALSQALEGVSVDSIIEFMAEIDRTRVALPAELGTLIARFCPGRRRAPRRRSQRRRRVALPRGHEPLQGGREPPARPGVLSGGDPESRRGADQHRLGPGEFGARARAGRGLCPLLPGQRPARPAGLSPAGPDHARGRGRVRHGLHRSCAALGQDRPVRAAARAADPIRGAREARPPRSPWSEPCASSAGRPISSQASWTRFAGTGGPTGPGRP